MIVKNLEEMSFEEMRQLNGATLVSMSLSSDSNVKNDLDRNITVMIASVKNATKVNPNETTLGSLTAASGYHRGSVVLVDEARKLNLSCYHKDRLFRIE